LLLGLGLGVDGDGVQLVARFVAIGGRKVRELGQAGGCGWLFGLLSRGLHGIVKEIIS
jgi:hypothetical protein